jgi:hypothetical protein
MWRLGRAVDEYGTVVEFQCKLMYMILSQNDSCPSGFVIYVKG